MTTKRHFEAVADMSSCGALSDNVAIDEIEYLEDMRLGFQSVGHMVVDALTEQSHGKVVGRLQEGESISTWQLQRAADSKQIPIWRSRPL